MNIGVVGHGNVAGCLGPLWAARGHRITYGVLAPQSREVKALVKRSGPDASAVAVHRLSKMVDIILLSVCWKDIPGLMDSLGNLQGKVLIDCTTPMHLEQRTLLLGHCTSGAELIAAMAPSAMVVKAFDTAGVLTMANPIYNEVTATVFICGDCPEAKGTVRQLAEGIGFEVCDAGALEVARYLEPVAMLWVHLAFNEGFGEDLGFKLLRRSSEE